MDTLDMKIRCDPSLKVLNTSEISLWRTRLSHLQIARLVSQYFGKRHDEKKTLAEVFSKVKFQYYGLDRGLGRRNRSWMDGEWETEGRRKATLLG